MNEKDIQQLKDIISKLKIDLEKQINDLLPKLNKEQQKAFNSILEKARQGEDVDIKDSINQIDKLK